MKFLGNIIWLLFRRDYNKCRISDIQPNTNDNDHWYTFWPPDLKISDTGFMAFGSRVVDEGNSGGCLSLIMNIIWIFVGGFLDLPLRIWDSAFAMYHDHRHPFRHATF